MLGNRIFKLVNLKVLCRRRMNKSFDGRTEEDVLSPIPRKNQLFIETDPSVLKHLEGEQ